jgi:glycine cleavage system aminomethyltransferase T
MGGTELSHGHDGQDATPRSAPLDTLLRHAGATMAAEHGAIVALDYGSSAGEVALGTRAVGIADRSELSVIELLGNEPEFDAQVEALTGLVPRVGRAVYLDGWWCLTGPARLVILAQPGREPKLAARLGTCPDLAASDITARRAVLSVLGPRAELLMTEGGLVGLPGMPLGATILGDLAGRHALVVRDGAASYLVSLAVDDAVHVWETLLDLGHPMGVGFIGREALDHLAVAARTRDRQDHVG